MLRTRVAVLRGGPSSEYEVSLQSGSSVLRNMPDGYNGIDIFIDKNGGWHRSGIPVSKYDALKNIDVVFNALHGAYGEDGKLSRELESLNMPFTGSGSLGSSMAMNKSIAKKRFKHAGLQVPEGIELTVSPDIGERMFDVIQTMELPVIVKPVGAGSSFGVTFAKSFGEIEAGVRKAFAYTPSVLIEEYIPGTEATVGVIEGFRDEDIYALSPIEIRPTENDIFDYDAKYKGRSLEISPGNFNPSDTNALKEMAKLAHHALGLRHYSRSDFIVSPGRGIYILETNALPGLTQESLIPKALKTANVHLKDFVKHVLDLALERN